MVACKLYVEGGGDGKPLRTECREAFSKFLEKAGLHGAMPRIVACGSRNDAYSRFCTAVGQGQQAFLLVDSEGPVDAVLAKGPPEGWRPWEHLRRHDNWTKPVSSSELNCHLMVQVMESWFLADKEALAAFFGQGFQEGALPSQSMVEAVAKEEVLRGLGQASRSCKTQKPYAKGPHSFKILASIRPKKISNASPWAKRFVDALTGKLKSGD